MSYINATKNLWHFRYHSPGTSQEKIEREGSGRETGAEDFFVLGNQSIDHLIVDNQSIDHLSGIALRSVATGLEEPNTPICCWNLCGNQAGKKQPRQPLPDAKVAATQSCKDAGTQSYSEIQIPDFKTVPDYKTIHRQEITEVAGGSQGFSASQSPALKEEAGTFTNEEAGTVAKRLLIERIGPDRSLVFHAVSGAVDVMSDADLAQLDQLRLAQPPTLPPARIAFLKARGYLMDSEEEEDQWLTQNVENAWRRMQTRQPEMYTLCPTLACNLACAYCFEGDSLLDKPQGVMTDAQVSQVFSAIGAIRTSLAARGQTADTPPWIALFGGEPLLPSTQRCVATIFQHAAEAGFLVGATTNGVNLTRFEPLLTQYADILATFQITLDGPRAVHDARRHRLGGQGTFDEIVRGIDLLLFLGIDVDLRVNLDRTNLAALPELADFIFQKGWNLHPGFVLAPAGVTDHSSSGGCGSTAKVLSEMELTQGILALMEQHPRLAQICHVGFLRHLDYLVGVLEPQKRSNKRGGAGTGPRYWYCEASTDKQFVFTPEGLIYSCTEAVGKPKHAIGRFDPDFSLWQEEAKQWIGRTILSHPQCHACTISTLCGGGCNFAAREHQAASETLIQVFVKGQSRDHTSGQDGGAEREEEKLEGKKRPPLPVLPYRNVPVSPYCNAAEQTVRAYLQHIGKQL